MPPYMLSKRTPRTNREHLAQSVEQAVGNQRTGDANRIVKSKRLSDAGSMAVM